MISKELLSEVLELPIVYVQDYVEVGEVVYETELIHEGINVYELAHKCKEWANKNGAHVTSTNRQGYYSNKALALVDCDWRPDEREIINADTEPGAIFKACEWILKEKH